MKFDLSKRQKIIITSIIVTSGLIATQSSSLFMRQNFIIALTLTTFLLCLWTLWTGMTKLKAFTLLTLPTLYTLGIASFYFLLPVRWLTKLPIGILFGLSFYFLLLSQNIFNVSTFRTIPLYRVASAVSFLATIFTGFLLFHVLRALTLSFVLNGLFVTVISFFLILPVLWSIELEKINKQMLSFALVLSLLMGEFATVLSFWPIPSNSLMWSIMITSILFILLGMSVDKFRNRLNSPEVYLYLGFGFFVFLVTFLTTSWTG